MTDSYDISGIDDRYILDFSEAQVKALSEHFVDGVSLIVKPPNGRRYSCSSLEEFCNPDYKATMATLTNFESKIDERLIRILKGIQLMLSLALWGKPQDTITSSVRAGDYPSISAARPCNLTGV